MAKTLLDVSHIMRGIYPLNAEELALMEKEQYENFLEKVYTSAAQNGVFQINGRGKTNDIR